MEPPSEQFTRGRSPYNSRYHQRESSNERRPNSHSTSNTPRRKGNPQSPSTPNKYNNNSNIISSRSSSISGGDDSLSASSLLTSSSLTPLSTLSTILTTHASHSHTAIQLYRQSHALHRHAVERTNTALDKLRLAQAELEHATTAQEYAQDEVEQSSLQKSHTQKEYTAICKRIRSQSKLFSNRRVKLVGLSKNATWNGRCGVIVKCITDGTSQDVGRWKVKLNEEWRGRDAEGGKIERCDTLSLDNTMDDNDDGRGNNGRSNINVVVAKAENLQLVDDDQNDYVGGGSGLNNDPYGTTAALDTSQSRRRLARSRSRSRGRSQVVSSSSSSSHRREETQQAQTVENTPMRRVARDPSMSPGHNYNHVMISPSSDNSSSGLRKSSLSSSSYKNQQSVHPKRKQQQRNSNSPRHVSPTIASPSLRRRQQYSTSSTTHIQRSPSNDDSERLSAAFSQMLTTPVSMQSPEQGAERQKQQYQIDYAGSFFEEVSEKNEYHPSSNEDVYYQQNSYKEHHDDDPQPQLTYESHYYNNENITNEEEEEEEEEEQEEGLPNIIVLPVPEDDYNNPFLSPGYSSDESPHCVGVQNAGISHVNGVYLLARPKDEENGNASEISNNNNSNNIPPLYFKDGPPVLLSDNMYYDMCILRIDCPDSTDHVIWFLAKVSVDPQCLDVKFSDCFYYCRMFKNDDGEGGEQDEGPCHIPPFRGWHVPSLPSGVEMLSIGGGDRSL